MRWRYDVVCLLYEDVRWSTVRYGNAVILDQPKSLQPSTVHNYESQTSTRDVHIVVCQMMIGLTKTCVKSIALERF